VTPRERAGLAALAALAVAVRFAIWQRSAAMMNDGPAFIALAQDAAAGRLGELLAHPYHPLYPLAVALVRPLFASWEGAAAAVSVAAGAVAVACLYAFLRSAFGPGVAAIGALLLAVHPYAAPYSADVQSEGLYMACFLAAVAATWRALLAPRLPAALLAGALAGLAYLARPEGIGVALVGMAVAAGLLARGLRPARAMAALGAGLALGAAVFVVPYTAAVARETGEVRLTRKKSVLAIATLEAGRRAHPGSAAGEGVEADWGERVADRLRPVGLAAGELAGAAKRAFRLDHFLVAGLGAWAAGGPLGLRGAFLGALALLYGFVLIGLHASVGYVSMRHALPPLLPLLGYVALGLPTVGRAVLWAPAALLRRGAPSPHLALAVGLALLATASTVMALRPQRAERAAARAAAEWLAAQDLPVERVAAAKEREAYYAGASHATLPDPRGARGKDWIALLAEQDVRYAIVDERPSKRYPGLDTRAPDPRLRVLHRVEAEGRVAWVVEIAEPEGPAGEVGVD